jgi:hypothetical protein
MHATSRNAISRQPLTIAGHAEAAATALPLTANISPLPARSRSFPQIDLASHREIILLTTQPLQIAGH